VQLEWLNEWRTKFDLGDDGSMEIIAGLIEHRRAPARLALEKELLQPRTNALVERLDALPSRVREHDPVLAGIPAAVVAPKIIQKVHRRIVRAGDAARQGEPVPEKLHALRITCKRFRYTLEAFDLLYANAAPVLRRTAALQELLGAYQDDEVAARDLQSFATHPSTGVGPSSAFALGRVAELHRTEQRALLLDFPKAYKYVTGSSWRNLRDEMRHERRRVREGGISGFVPRAARDRLGA
jgi:CHAD domain-containing protein